jgi:hypothetical protein
MIENGQVSILMPPLYGAVKGKIFVPIYKIEDTKKYRDSVAKRGYTSPEVDARVKRAKLDSMKSSK